MTDRSFRDALLKQNGAFSMQAELSALNNLLEEDRRRARRLTMWTAAVWGVWLLLLMVSLGQPMIMRAISQQTSSPAPTSGAPAQRPTAAPGPAHRAGSPPVIGVIIGVTCLAAFLCLPVVGVLLLVMMVVGRRSVTMRQIQCSLASIDVQLKRLLEQKTS